MKIIVTIIPTNLVTKSLLSLFCPFEEITNENLVFSKLSTRNVSIFCLWQVTLYFTGMPNSLEFYKRIFLNVIPARIIVPCSQQ